MATLKTTIIFDRKVWREAKLAAVEDDKGISDLVGEAVEQYLKSRKARQTRGS